jgi:hypothetical protein
VGGELAYSGEEGKVKCSCIKEQGPNYFWIHVFSAGETGVERVVMDEGEG